MPSSLAVCASGFDSKRALSPTAEWAVCPHTAPRSQCFPQLWGGKCSPNFWHAFPGLEAQHWSLRPLITLLPRRAQGMSGCRCSVESACSWTLYGQACLEWAYMGTSPCNCMPRNFMMAQFILSVPYGADSTGRPDTICVLLCPMAAQVAFIEWMNSVEKRSKSEAFWVDLHKALLCLSLALILHYVVQGLHQCRHRLPRRACRRGSQRACHS